MPTLHINGQLVAGITLGGQQVQKIQDSNGTVLYQKETGPDYFTLTNTYAGNNTLTISKNGTPSSTDLAYSLDGNTWTSVDMTQSSTTVQVPEGGNIKLRSSTGLSSGTSDYIIFRMSANHTASGDVRTLFDYTDVDSVTTFPVCGLYRLFYQDFYITDASGIDISGIALSERCLSGMFESCSALTSVPALPATTLAERCYQNLFRECSALTSAPALPATTLSNYCYRGMFSMCGALTTAPNLSHVTTVGDYSMYEMFNSTGLINPPSLGNVTTVGTFGMGSMFNNCNSLVSPPDMSSITTVGDSAFNGMFKYCSALKTAPDITGITHAPSSLFNSSFMNCTSLTTGVNLTNITTYGSNPFMSMYANDTKLTTAYAPNISTWTNTPFQNWLSGVASTGTIYATAQTAAVIPTGNNSGCPSGWTVTVLNS